MNLSNPLPVAKLVKHPNGQIYQLFGESVELYKKAIGTNGHNGIDIIPPDGKSGHPVVASANGIIMETDKLGNGTGGKCVRILTDPDEKGIQYELHYFHLEDITCEVNQRVFRDEKIATVGNTGFIISGNTPYWGNAPAGKGVHLHFGVKELAEPQGTWNVQYQNGQKFVIKNYDNGFKGCIDPVPFFSVSKEVFSLQVKILELRIAIAKRLIEIWKGRK